MGTDFYRILGVSEDAGKEEIKKVYRRLAKKYHPDRNKGNKAAEAKFKGISEAYDTLSDEKKRTEYDTLRKYGAFAGGPTGGFDFSRFSGGGAPGGFDFSRSGHSGPGGFSFRFGNVSGDAGAGFEGLEDVLTSFFGGGMPGARGTGGGPRCGSFGTSGTSARRPQQGVDIRASVTIPFMEAAKGTVKTLSQVGGGKKLKVRIPAGIEDGGRIRLRGQGQPAPLGGRNGDLIITVRVMPDQDFRREGNDIYSSIEILFTEAIKGCRKNVKTLTRTVALTIPPGTQPGTKLRLKGMGLSVGSVNGDQYVEIKVKIPTSLTEKQKKLLDEWEEQ